MLRTCTIALTITLLIGTAHAQDAAKPNIVWIMADDLGYGDLGVYGSTKIKTPRLDQMAAEGMRFTQFYSGSTVCAPARAVLMTGLHTGHAYVRGNSNVPLRPSDYTVAEALKESGYTTGLVGKWGIGEPGTTGIPNKQGFDFFYGFLNQSRAHFYYPPYVWRNETKIEFPGNDQEAQTGEYVHDLMTQEALGFVEQNADKPFFLYLAYTIPHAEVVVPEDSMEPYRGEWPEGEPYPEGKHYGAQDEPHAAFAGMVSRLDRDVGRLLDLLREKGIAENTVVFFTSDNGPHEEGGADPEFFESNGPLTGIKRDLYEGGIRVPLIAWWPGRIEAGATSHHVGGFQDFFATSLDLVGRPRLSSQDGISILPTLTGERPQEKHQYLYWEFYERGGKQAVRWGLWKGVRLNVHEDRNGPIELYDLGNDPAEQNNIAADHPKVVRAIQILMEMAHTPSAEFNFKSDNRNIDFRTL